MYEKKLENLWTCLYVHLKGTVSRDGYLLKIYSKQFNKYFPCMRRWFSRSFKAFHCRIQWLTFYLLLFNFLLILNMRTETILKIQFSVIGRCSLVSTSQWLQGKCARIDLSIGSLTAAASCMLCNCQNRRFGSLKVVTNEKGEAVGDVLTIIC